ncbi:MAG TPA: hypothetical protein VFX30_12795 [bacterium]|nr:hypothetical protein [bacterium]
MSLSHEIGEPPALRPNPLDLSFVASLIQDAVAMIVIDRVLRVLQRHESGLITLHIAFPGLSDAPMGLVEGVCYIGRQIVRNRNQANRTSKLVKHGVLLYVVDGLMDLLPVRAAIIVIPDQLPGSLDPLLLGLIGHLRPADAVEPIRKEPLFLVEPFSIQGERLLGLFPNPPRDDQLVLSVVPLASPIKAPSIEGILENLLNRTQMSKMAHLVGRDETAFQDRQPDGLVAFHLRPEFEHAPDEVACSGVRQEDLMFSAGGSSIHGVRNIPISKRRLGREPPLLGLLPHALDGLSGGISGGVFPDRCHDVVDEDIRDARVAIKDFAFFVEVNFDLTGKVELLDHFLVAVISSEPVGFFGHQCQCLLVRIVLDEGKDLVEFLSLRLFAGRFLKREGLDDLKALLPSVFGAVPLLGVERVAFLLFAIRNSIDDDCVHRICRS